MTHPALAPPLAVERYRALEPHLTDGVALAELARAGVASERTLQRWLRCYRAEGLAGLDRLPRSDRGRSHMPDHLVTLVRDLAGKRPRPPLAATHRKVAALAIAEGRQAPSYSSVGRIAGSVPESRIAAASDPAAYRDHYDPRDLTEVHVYHEGRFICRALSPEHLGAPSLRDIQRARRDAKKRDTGAHHHGGCR